MTDRQLLEQAAKAAGIEIAQWSNIQAGGFIAKGSAYLDSWGDERIPRDFWNPLTNDGDALRLAVKLGINLELHNINLYGAHKGSIECECEGEPYAATRRAIVLAAAEIGKGL